MYTIIVRSAAHIRMHIIPRQIVRLLVFFAAIFVNNNVMEISIKYTVSFPFVSAGSQSREPPSSRQYNNNNMQKTHFAAPPRAHNTIAYLPRK